MIFDKEIFLLLNSLAKIPIFVTVAGLVANEYFVPVAFSLILFYLWITPGKYNKQTVLLAAGSVGLVNLFVKLINLAYWRPRPFEEMVVNLVYYRPTDSSFPSNASSVAFAIAAAVWWFNPKLGWWLLALSAVYGLSRVIVGVHYPTDVLAGALLGVGTSLLLSRLKRPLEWATETLVSILKYCKLEPIP